MLKRFAKFRPSPAMAVALLGVVLGLGSTGWAANGGAFILGVINSATQQTALVANYNGMALALSNSSTGTSATALTLVVAAGHPPMKINSTTKVANLNADYLDGIDSSGLVRRGADVSGSISISSIAANACGTLNFSVHGALVGDVVAFTFKGNTALPGGLIVVADRVTSAGNIRARVCNSANSASTAVSGLGIRVLTFR